MFGKKTLEKHAETTTTTTTTPTTETGMTTAAAAATAAATHLVDTAEVVVGEKRRDHRATPEPLPRQRHLCLVGLVHRDVLHKHLRWGRMDLKELKEGLQGVERRKLGGPGLFNIV